MAMAMAAMVSARMRTKTVRWRPTMRRRRRTSRQSTRIVCVATSPSSSLIKVYVNVPSAIEWMRRLQVSCGCYTRIYRIISLKQRLLSNRVVGRRREEVGVVVVMPLRSGSATIWEQLVPILTWLTNLNRHLEDATTTTWTPDGISTLLQSRIICWRLLLCEPLRSLPIEWDLFVERCSGLPHDLVQALRPSSTLCKTV